jgi:hypothetical protein
MMLGNEVHQSKQLAGMAVRLLMPENVIFDNEEHR